MCFCRFSARSAAIQTSTASNRGGVPIGAFLTALVAFLIVAAVIYFFVIKPYEAVKARFSKTEVDAAPDEDVVLLTEIRDSARSHRANANLII